MWATPQTTATSGVESKNNVVTQFTLLTSLVVAVTTSSDGFGIVSWRCWGCDPATHDDDRLVTFSGGSGASAAQVVDPESGPAENRTPEPLIKSAEPEQTEPTSANEPPKIAETAGGNAARPPQYAGEQGAPGTDSHVW